MNWDVREFHNTKLYSDCHTIDKCMRRLIFAHAQNHIELHTKWTVIGQCDRELAALHIISHHFVYYINEINDIKMKPTENKTQQRPETHSFDMFTSQEV